MTLRDRASGLSRSVPVNGSGEFRLINVRPGEYDLTVEAFGLRPQRLEGITVRAGASTHVEPVLTRSENPNVPVEVRRYEGAAGRGTQQLHAFELDRLPLSGRDIGALAQLSTISTATLETEGLPGGLSGVRIDGLAIGSPVRAGGSVSVLPQSAFARAEILNASADVEWAGTAAPALSLQTVGSGPRASLRGYGAWLKGPERVDDLTSPVFNGLQAGALLSGPFMRDTAAYVIGFEIWRLELPLASRTRADSLATRATAIARDIYGVQAPGSGLNRLAQMNAASGFARLDWRFGEAHTLRTSGAFTSMPRALTVPSTLDRVGAQSELRGLDGYVSTVLTSNLSETLGQEFRIGLDRTVRDFNAEARAAFGEGSTSIVEDDFGLGRDPVQIGNFATSTFRLRETLHFPVASHHVKFGVSADIASHDFTYLANRTSTFWYSSIDDFARGSGYGVATSGIAASQFSIPRYGAFLQDEWSVGSRIRVLLGARWDMDAPPTEDIVANSEWQRLTGIRLDTALSRHGRLSPRFEFEWRPSPRWALRASGGIWDAPMDPVLFGEVLAYDGGVTVQRGFGSFQDWPQADVATGRPSLTLLADGFQGPRSTRGVIQLSRTLVPGVDLTLGGVFRRTELLPRRVDLNLAPSAALRDQYDREIFGTLQQRGSVIAATSGSNRRFSAFDVVSAIGVDGWSEYRGAEASLQASVANSLQLSARYTYSQTEDNWFMARDGNGLGEPSPFRPSSTAVDWTEGRSDFDVPHRATLGVDLTLPGLRGLHLAALYRYRSGYPFTPGFPAGVDANGDGSLRNDPAFVDPNSASFSILASAWPCLVEQQGRMATRNSCRAPAASFLDARVSFGLTSGSGRSAELVIDALNLMASGAEEVDRALYRVNPLGTLTIDDVSRRVNVPLMLNPNFGAPLLRAIAPRTLRVGLRVTY